MSSTYSPPPPNIFPKSETVVVPSQVPDIADITYEIARSISILHGDHYSHCHVGHEFPQTCPLFKAWDERRPR